MKKIIIVLILMCIYILPTSVFAETLIKCSYTIYKNSAKDDNYGSITVDLSKDGSLKIDKSIHTLSNLTTPSDFNKNFKERVDNSNTCPNLCLYDPGTGAAEVRVGDTCGASWSLEPTILENNTGKDVKKEQDYCTRYTNTDSLNLNIRFFKDIDGADKYQLEHPNGAKSDYSTSQGFLSFEGKTYWLDTTTYFGDRCMSAPMFFKSDDRIIYYIRETNLTNSEQNNPISTIETDPNKTGNDPNKNNIKTEPIGYIGDNICSNNHVMSILVIVGYILVIAKLVVPIIIVAMGTYDLYKAVIANEGKADVITKQAKMLGIRIFIGIMIFFIPTMVNALMTALTDNDILSKEIENCQTCILNPTKCNINPE